MSEEFKTIIKAEEGVYKEKGSKFLAFSYLIEKEQDVKHNVSLLKKNHPQARHICWAYKIGYNGEVQKCNDDGEPSGTAGRPILGQLESFDVTFVLVCVVRYFGGTLLGTGGLTQAYKQATLECLTNSGIVIKQKLYKVNILCNYEQLDAILSLLKRFNAQIHTQDFSQECNLECEITKENLQEMQKLITYSNTFQLNIYE